MDESEENPVILRSLELLHAAIGSLIRNDASSDQKEILHSVFRNVGAMRAILDPALTDMMRTYTVDTIVTSEHTPKIMEEAMMTTKADVVDGVASSSSSSSSPSSSLPHRSHDDFAKDLSDMSDAMWSEIDEAERQEAELEGRRKQRAIDRERLAVIAKAKEAALAAIVKIDAWLCPTCTLQNSLKARKCEACSTYRPAEAKPKPPVEVTVAAVALSPDTESHINGNDNWNTSRSKSQKSLARDKYKDNNGEGDVSEEEKEFKTSPARRKISTAVRKRNTSTASSSKGGAIQATSPARSVGIGTPKSASKKRSHASATLRAGSSSSQLPTVTCSSSSSRRPRSDSMDSAASSNVSGSGRGMSEAFRSPYKSIGGSRGSGLGGGGMWMQGSRIEGGEDEKEEQEEDAAATKLVWCCAMCTLENDMRARVCEACGESRAHAIRGEPSVFLMGDSPRVKRVKVGDANPRRLPLIGGKHQIDPGSLPVYDPSAARDAYLESIAKYARNGSTDVDVDVDSRLHEYDPTVAHGQLIWLAPRSSSAIHKCGVVTTAGASTGTERDGDVDMDMDMDRDRDRDRRRDEDGGNSTAYNRVQKFLSAFAGNQALAMRELTKSNYDVAVAEIAVRNALSLYDSSKSANANVSASIFDASNANAYSLHPSAARGAQETLIHPSWVEEAVLTRALQYSYRSLDMPAHDCPPHDVFTACVVDSFADGIANYGDSWSAVRKFMASQGHVANFRQIQDYFYGAWSSPDMRLRARACEMAYEAKIKSQEVIERKQQAEESSRRRKIEAEKRREERLRELSVGVGSGITSDASASASVSAAPSPVNLPQDAEFRAITTTDTEFMTETDARTMAMTKAADVEIRHESGSSSSGNTAALTEESVANWLSSL